MSRKSSSSRYDVHHDDRLTITLFGKSADFRNSVGNKILKDAFTHTPDRCVMSESSSLKIVNTPDFFDAGSQYPDQYVIDCMALTLPGPNLVLLAVDSENSQEKEVMGQIRTLQYVFGEDITANLVVLLPTADVLKSLHHLKKRFKIHLEPVSDKLSSDCWKWCSGQRSFKYNFNNYSKDVVRRRRSTLDQRRCPPEHRQGSRGADPRTPSVSQRSPTEAGPWMRLSRRSLRGTRDTTEGPTQGSRGSADSKSHFNLVLLGLTGTGKSASANTILAAANLSRDSSPFRSELSSVPVTTKCEAKTVTFLRKKVTVMDTPDFFSGRLGGSEAQIDACRRFCELRQSVVLLVVQLGRFTDQEVGILEKLEAKLGLSIRDKAVVLLTHGEDFSGKLEKFIEDRRPLRDLVAACGNRYHVFKNTSKHPRQVLDLIRKCPDIDVFFPELTEKRSVFMCF